MLLYWPTYSQWRNPIEMLWRFEVTPGEVFTSVKALLQAVQRFFNRYDVMPQPVLSGALPS